MVPSLLVSNSANTPLKSRISSVDIFLAMTNRATFLKSVLSAYRTRLLLTLRESSGAGLRMDRRIDLVINGCWAAALAVIRFAGSNFKRLETKFLASSETLFQALPSNVTLPSRIFLIMAFLNKMWDLASTKSNKALALIGTYGVSAQNGFSPTSNMYVMTPIDHISACEPEYSASVTSGAMV